MNNQRLTSNADSLFDSLYKLFENSNAFTQTQFEQYFNSFIKDFNNLFNLIDLKIFGLQLDNQLTYNKNVKLYEELSKEINSFSDNNIKNFISNQKEDFDKKNETIKNIFLKNYNNYSDSNKTKYYIKVEKDIQNNIIEYYKNMNGLIYKLNQINEKLCVNDNNIQQIIIAYSKNILNKETRTKHLENKYDPIIGIGNLFISFTNWWNEKSKMETYINKYLEEINDLIETNNKIFIDRVNLERQRLLK